MYISCLRMCLALSLLAGGWSSVRGAERPIDYSKQVRPILSTKCFTCHGPDADSREAGLRLDSREAAIAVLDSDERAIVPGDPEASELIRRLVTTEDYELMPPKETGKQLTADEIEILRLWIQEGASYVDHWSFRPITRPAVPELKADTWSRHPIDQFILEKLRENRFEPSPQASRATLIRRLSLDLLGLPPSYSEVEAFVADERPEAYAELVDRLLASPHFGERWGRHWLDLARYADSNGYLGDELRPEAYRYRDWVINSINEDQPYDQFTIEQIAGDLLPQPTDAQKLATGLHRQSMVNTEAGADRELDRVIQNVDRISTIGTAWLGLTVACAECHTHKYDPISHREFYQMYAFFNNTDPSNLVVGEAKPKKEDEKTRLEREQKLEAIAEKLLKEIPAGADGDAMDISRYLAILAETKADRPETDKEALDFWLADLSDSAQKLARDYEKLALQRPRPTQILAPVVRQAKTPRATHVHLRGDYRQPGEEVTPGTPAFLPPLNPRNEMADRLDLAEWLMRDEQPLTARTAVNHFWQHLFGRGLVDTPDNFGTTGSEPSHPELLDWLAVEFRESGWSRKAILKQIVMSATYQQSSVVTPDHIKRDPQNVLLARQSRLRLEGEIVRDQALSASGLLNPKIGGASIRPPMNSRITQVSRNQAWPVSSGAEKYRRGLYILFRRATPYPMLTTFDVPASTMSCAARERSSSPLQALALLNDPVFVECAQHLGRDLAMMGPVDEDVWLETAVQRTLSRRPTPEEQARLRELTAQLRAMVTDTPADELQQIVLKEKVTVDLAEYATRVLVGRSLMNLEEFITRE